MAARKPPVHLGDSHNFGRRVSPSADRVHKPRAILWEWLVLGTDSPLRPVLADAAEQEGLGRDAFAFLPELRFFPSREPWRDGGEVERVALDPLPPLSPEGRRELARIVGRSLALFSWLGVSDLHWENLVLGVGAGGRVVFGPLDVEMILADLSLPTETKLLPDADPEYAAVCRHAAGVRRVLPYLGKPIGAEDLLAMASAYAGALTALGRHAPRIADVLARLPELGTTPIRILLRGTGDYARAGAAPLWPPLLAAEEEQLARGDIPYFFRLHGRRGIHYYADPTLREIKTLPQGGDVPQLDPILPLAPAERALRSPTRKKLREEGLFTLLGAFDHPALQGRHEADGLGVTFQARTLIVKHPKAGELVVRRNLRAFVGSVYLPCSCGEVGTVFVPPVTVCDAPA
jgi:hypothetical protein